MFTHVSQKGDWLNIEVKWTRISKSVALYIGSGRREFWCQFYWSCILSLYLVWWKERNESRANGLKSEHYNIENNSLAYFSKGMLASNGYDVTSRHAKMKNDTFEVKYLSNFCLCCIFHINILQHLLLISIHLIVLFKKKTLNTVQYIIFQFNAIYRQNYALFEFHNVVLSAHFCKGTS